MFQELSSNIVGKLSPNIVKYRHLSPSGNRALLNSSFSGEMMFLRKLKLIDLSTPAGLEQLFSPYLFNFIQKNC